jgi:D-xylose 1-dehydrogenase (NADP+, D-xylono-1,5-lactone-forming)
MDIKLMQESKINMNDKSIKIGMVGCGEISHTHAEAVNNINDAAFITCCDVVEDKARNWSERYKCNSYYTDLETMLNNEKVDALVLCTWPIQHLEQIEIAMSHGIKNFLCEKSMSLLGTEALKIYHVIKEHNAFLMEACKYRYHPAVKKIEALLNSNELGKIDNISATFSNYEPDDDVNTNTGNWRYRYDCGGGVAYDWMSYLVNAANHFSKSKPKRVFASGTVSKRFNVITRLYGLIEYENGITANISSSKNASFSQELKITCAKGIINSPVTWGIFGDVSLSCNKRIPEWPYIHTDFHEIKHKDSFILQMQNFINAIQGKSIPTIPLEESVINVFTIEALVNSLTENQLIELKIPEL